MPKVLILCHMEEQFEDCFHKSFKRSLSSILRRKWDKVIHLFSKLGSAPLPLLEGKVTETIEWAWGWEPCIDDETGEYIEEDDRFIRSIHSVHSWALIPDEFRNPDMHDWDITIAGGCDGVCLGNLESVLCHLGILYTRAEDCIFRDGKHYSYVLPTLKQKEENLALHA